MKSTFGTPPKRLAPPRQKVRLNLRRARSSAPEWETVSSDRQRSSFWKWMFVVLLLHLAVLAGFFIYYRAEPAKPPESFISLLPEGDVAHGTPGTQAASKVSAVTSAAQVKAVPALPKPPPPVKPKTHVVPLKQVARVMPPTPAEPAPAKPTPSKKVKVDLTLAEGPAAETAVTHKPVAKPKSHPKKAAAAPTATAAPAPESDGLSRDQVAAKLGDKLAAAGVEKSTRTGPNGAAHSQANPYADFYASIRDQVMGKWASPNLTDETAVSPIVQIHVEKDGRVPAEMVQLTQSSGNPTYDDSALTAARSLGYLLQPLPEGCPPDIPITFKLTR